MKQINPILLVLLSLGFFNVQNSFAQDPADYSFYASTKTYNYLTDGSTPKGTYLGDESISENAIGFAFNFCGTDYTKIYAGSNVWIALKQPGKSSDGGSFYDNALAANVNDLSPYLAPLWDDMWGGSPASASLKTSGRGRNHVFTYEWKNWGYWSGSTPGEDVISLQVKLYEYGAIEYLYKQESKSVPTDADGATIGMVLSPSKFNVLNNSSTSPTPTSSTYVTSILTRPATGQSYMWFPKSGSDNAGALEIYAPGATFCAGMETVKVKIINSGKNKINSLKVYWEIDGVTQTPVTYNNVIDTFGSAAGHIANVILGNVQFNNIKTIKVYTSAPNGNSDDDTRNDTLVQVIGPSPNASVTASGTTIFCTAGAINVTLNANSSAPTNYQWFRDGQPIPGATNSSYTATIAGDYTLKADSNGCTNTSDIIKVQNQAMPMPVVTPNGFPTICDSLTLTANAGVTGASYQWQHQGVDIPGATNASYTATAQGNYTVITSRYSCTATSPGITLVQGSKPTPKAEQNSNGVLQTSTTYSAYQWYLDGNAIPGATSFAHIPRKNGDYYVEVSNGGCSGLSDTIKVEGVSVKNIVNTTGNIKIYPNPAKSILYIEAEDNINVFISSVEGKLMLQQQLSSGKIDISSLPAGLYIIKLTSEDGNMLSTNKFIKVN